jgi:predicted nucleic acid-binding protein
MPAAWREPRTKRVREPGHTRNEEGPLNVYVIDASVASRFLLVEDLSDKAELLLKSFLEEAVDMRAPDLIKSEVGNTLWKAVKQKLILLNEASEKLSYFHRLKIRSIELSERDYLEALAWGVRNDATYYDSIYVRSSMKIQSPLLTADDTLFDKAFKTVDTLHLRDLR